MPVYSFEVHLSGNLGDTMDDLYRAGWDDATVSGDHSGGYGGFSREAGTAVEAVISAIKQAESCGLQVTGVTEDLVTLGEIAERTGRTLAAVDNWVKGRRGPGGFPPPRVARGRAALYGWADVATWLAARDVVDIKPAEIEIAHACMLIDAAIRTRQGLRELPQGDRERVLQLVA